VTNGASQPLQVVLCENDETGSIAVESKAFVRFSEALDDSLDRLEGQWGHLAPPMQTPRRKHLRRPKQET
jgi:hypothetical protein